MTGSYPFVHGINTFVSGRLRPTLPTLAEVFKAHGYHTWAELTGPLEPMTGLDRGFDDYRHRHYTEWFDIGFGDALIEKLTGDRSRPWFGFLHLWETHTPRRITEEYTDRKYGRNSYERAVSSLDRQLARILAAVSEDTIVILTGDHGEYLSDSRGTELIGEMKRGAAWLRRHSQGGEWLRGPAMTTLAKIINRSRQRRNDLFRAWQGHGFHVYDPLVHVPLIFYGPGLFPRGVEVKELTSHVDIFPTLVSALGLNHSVLLSGMNLMPYIQQVSGKWNERAIYIQASGARGMVEPHFWLMSVRTERYKYIRSWSDRMLPEELYDLKLDPAERANLALYRPDLVHTMRAYLDAIFRSAPESLDTAVSAFVPSELEFSSDACTT